MNRRWFGIDHQRLLVDVGDWADERRNLAVDFRNAFGDVAPFVTGIAVAADTDQTGESVTAWFGDIRYAK